VCPAVRLHDNSSKAHPIVMKFCTQNCHDEQAIKYEIAMFKKWLSMRSVPESISFPDLQLTNINQIVTQLLFQISQTPITNLSIDENNSTDKFAHALAHQTLSKAESIAQAYAQKAVEVKNKLLHTKSHHKNIILFDQIITLITKREQNMMEHAQYDIQQQLLRQFN
jgi:hypothetical protein